MPEKIVNPSPLIAIIGPTASGKSKLALKLAKKYHGAIISADSQQLYQSARVGTNQPDGKWQAAPTDWQRQNIKKFYSVQGVPHFFVDILPPNRPYSAAGFQTEATRLCVKLRALGYLPILTGGTGLYISSIVEGYHFPKGKPNHALRQHLERLSYEQLKQKLKAADNHSYKTIDLKNRRRIIRALEHVLTTGTSFARSQTKTLRPNTLILNLAQSKPRLKQAIAKRTQSMLRQGLIQEAQALLHHYPTSPLLASIGYREAVRYLHGGLTTTELAKLINTHTWHYARRQLAWFRRLKQAHLVTETSGAMQLVKRFLSKQTKRT